MTTALIIIAAGLLALLLRRYGLTSLIPARFGSKVVALALVGVLGTGFLIHQDIIEIHKSWNRKNWPITTGKILASSLTAGRVYRPEVIYSYTIGGVIYEDTTSLQAPGFGGKNQRYDTAVKLLAEYPVGSSVEVHFDPGQPSESDLIVAVRWDKYVKLSFYILINFLCILLVLPGRRIDSPAKSS